TARPQTSTDASTDVRDTVTGAVVVDSRCQRSPEYTTVRVWEPPSRRRLSGTSTTCVAYGPETVGAPSTARPTCSPRSSSVTVPVGCGVAVASLVRTTRTARSSPYEPDAPVANIATVRPSTSTSCGADVVGSKSPKPLYVAVSTTGPGVANRVVSLAEPSGPTSAVPT